ncbi:MAG: hypothetical protein AAF125_24220, partial [Chloroflexota bacterium]
MARLLSLAGTVWVVLFAAMIVAVHLPLQRTSAAVSYLDNGWLYATDLERSLTVQVVRHRPYHPSGIYGVGGIRDYMWSPDGRALLYQYTFTDVDTRARVQLFLRHRNGQERLLAEYPYQRTGIDISEGILIQQRPAIWRPHIIA